MHRIIVATHNEKRIEQLRVRAQPGPEAEAGAGAGTVLTEPGLQAGDSLTWPAAIRDFIARRAAKEFRNGMYVNLGIGEQAIVSKLAWCSSTLSRGQRESCFIQQDPQAN